MPNNDQFQQVFAGLKSLLKPYLKKMDVKKDTDTEYWLYTRFLMRNKQPLCFGGVRMGKNYVSYHLLSVYASPALLKTISPELKKRMQGKACFNFKEVDKKLFAELKTLTKVSATKFTDPDFVDSLRMMQQR